MTYEELAEHTRQTMRDAFADLATDDDPPYGLSIAEANAAMTTGIALAASDFIVAASIPTDHNRRCAAGLFGQLVVSLVEQLSAEGRC